MAQALTADGNELAPTKNDSSKRVIPIGPEILLQLSKWKEAQAAKLSENGVSQDGGTPVVCNRNGGLTHPENFGRWWRRWRKKHGFEPYSLHQLRHSFATLLVANDTDMVTAAGLMGHSDITMLAKVYAHRVPENAVKATEALGSSLFNDI